MAPVTLRPDPANDAALTVTDEVPLDVRSNVCVADEFTDTLPNAMLVALIVSVGTEAPNWIANVFEVPPELAVKVAVWAVLTAVIFAINVAVIVAADTVTEAGTVTALLLLERFTTSPPRGADAFRVRVQLSDPAPVIELVVQLRALTIGMPVPLRGITEVPAGEELLVIVNCPLDRPAMVGLNCTVSEAD